VHHAADRVLLLVVYALIGEGAIWVIYPTEKVFTSVPSEDDYAAFLRVICFVGNGRCKDAVPSGVVT
jgi:hypothetical protein